jgi:hypothetical protein
MLNFVKNYVYGRGMNLTDYEKYLTKLEKSSQVVLESKNSLSRIYLLQKNAQFHQNLRDCEF